MKMLDKIKANIEIIVMSVVLFNICMTLLHGLLGVVKNYTATKVDNKAWKIVGRLVRAGQKAIDYSVANKAH
jgi:hypothetical protein